MNLQGLTSEFSLPELFKFLQESQQTGRLSLKALEGSDLGSKTRETSHFFWFEKGNLLAASNRLDGLGLLDILQARSLIQGSTLPRLVRQCPPKVALGAFLKDRAVLTHKQLKSLFASQVLRHACALLKAPDAKFSFHAAYPVPYLEMTGIKIKATDVTLPSLRILKDWGALADKLPSLESGLKLIKKDPSTYRLQTQEKDVLRLAQSGLSLSKIAKDLKLSVVDIQKTGFRLIFVGLVKEIPLIQTAKSTYQPRRRTSVQLSKSFLGRLSGYLQKIPLMSMSSKETAPQKPQKPKFPVAIPVAISAVRAESTTTSYRQRINPEKTPRNSAVKRLTYAIGGDRAEGLSKRAPSCLLTAYPSCLLASSAV